MAVWCRQTTDGEVTDLRIVAPHFEDQSDADLLAIKASSASEKGWSVEWTGPQSFTATKGRWAEERPCIREFWSD